MTGITINRLIFNDGTPVEVSPQDIVIFVGPNNMGKSQSLRDIFNCISNENGSVVVSNIDISYHDPPGLKSLIESSSLISPIGRNLMYRGYNYQIYSQNIQGFGNGPRVEDNIRKFLVSRVNTEERLTTSSPKQMVNPGDPRVYPLQYVTDPENRKRISDVFEKIFSKKIFCEDRGSTMITLRMGDDIVFSQNGMLPQQVSDELYRRMSSLPRVHEQGDGIRSLAGLLLHLMMPNYSMFLIDEPEAFLHPPQARTLGSILPSLLPEKQAFISTHSIDLIKGLLTSARDRVKIIRITRKDNTNKVKHLEQADIDVIWDDPIMRHSNMIDCLFYDHTVLCESDSDCQLYSLALENIKSRTGQRSDTLFIHCGGKGRMHLIAKELRALGVDYRIIPDLDVFDNRGLVKGLVDANGGDWLQFQQDYDLLAKIMNMPGNTMSPDEFLDALRRKIEQRGFATIAKAEAKRISDDAKSILENQWDALKHKGIDYIQDGNAKASIERLIVAFNKLNVYPVKVGELENFIPQFSDHGPGYAVAVLEKYPNIGASEYDKIRDFVSSWGI